MTLMILRYHSHIKLQSQAVVWCHLMTVSNLHQYWNLMDYYPCSCRRFNNFLTTFPCIFSAFFIYFLVTLSFCIKIIFSIPRLSGVYGDTWFSLVPLPVFVFLVYKFLVEAKFFLGWSFLPSCWILRTSWWETYKIFKLCCC